MRRARRAPAAVAFAVAALLVVGCGVASGRTALERAASADHPARFVFVDRPDAASLMECLGAAETLVVTVDTERNAMAVRRQDETNPVVVWTADASFVDASLLTSGVGWVRVGRDLAGPTRAEVEAAVGSSLSGWVFAERIAPDPMTISDFGISAGFMASKYVQMFCPSGAMPGRVRGRAPVAIMMWCAP